ncbi:hypothetical protein E3N88_22752 [Mikania micrantha]|uniref:Uncharacterized protein n=1 Tax=Mikania micrantha TaxID=192012 RepID=A0A5N6NBC0_9ASTR|nr:hypothetical protein E3N88_22752 [Mikania micrantha]
MLQENDKTEALMFSKYFLFHSDDNDLSSRFCKIVSSMKKLRWVNVTMDQHVKSDGGPTFLSNELRYINWTGYLASPFPNNFHPIKLGVLKLRLSNQKELWKGCKQRVTAKATEKLKIMKTLEMTRRL